MFYSHTFLARKSSLGTVWIAAHLQHKIRKSHVTVTDISSSVGTVCTHCIIYPEVPIALRLSGHLLLGVVRIYSKKVDYLYHDSNEVLTRLRTVFSSIQEVNLPENASHAPFHTMTLPDAFELDAFNLDAEIYSTQGQDDHLKNQEDITIADPSPNGEYPYVAFFINEDMIMDVSPPVNIPELEGGRMEEDVPSLPAYNREDVSVPGPSNHVEENSQIAEDQSTQVLPDVESTPVIPDVEVMRDSVHEFGMDNQFDDVSVTSQIDHVEASDHSNQVIPEVEVMRDSVNELGPDSFPDLMDLDNNGGEQHNLVEENTIEKNLSPIIGEPSVSGAQLASSRLHVDPSTAVASANSSENIHSNSSMGNVLPEMTILPSPPVETKQAKSRKRKQFYDNTVVLTNEFMKESLKDASKLMRKQRRLPCSALDAWKFNNRSRMEQVFLQSSISGLNANLQSLFKKDTVCSRVPMLSAPNPVSDPDIETVVPNPVPDPDRETEVPNPVPDPDIETECLRSVEDHVDNSNFPHFMPSPIRNEQTSISPSNLVSQPQTEVFRIQETKLRSPSPFRDEHTPLPSSNLVSEPQTEVLLTQETELRPMSEQTASSFGLEMETPMTRSEERFDMESTGLSDIPELQNSAEELNFLEADNTPDVGGHEENDEASALSMRTRAVAQYLKSKSPESGISSDPSGNLSLNKILEGKTRKQCAQLFYETLVLKSFDLIDIQQNEAYGDVTLSLTSKLVNTKSLILCN